MMPGILGDILRRLSESESENEKIKCRQPRPDAVPRRILKEVSTNAEYHIQQRLERLPPNRRGGL